MMNVTITKFIASETNNKTPSKFPCFEILKGVSNNINGVYYTMEDSYDAVDTEASKTEAPEYGPGSEKSKVPKSKKVK